VKGFIKAVGTGPHGSRDLTSDEAYQAAGLILSGSSTPAQTGAFLVALRTKGEASEEIEGFLKAARARMATNELSKAEPFDGLDIGDPYDGHTRHPGISLPAALLAAGAGLPVVLHGDTDLPAKFGLGHVDLWGALGYSTASPESAMDRLRKEGVVCLSQERLIPEWAKQKSVRKELGLRTVMNTVEKCVNPLNMKTMAVGYFHEALAERLFRILESIYPSSRIHLVSGSEGSVDLYPHRPTRWNGPSWQTSPKTSVLPHSLSPLPTIPPDPISHAKFVRDVLGDPSHPNGELVRHMAAFFLFIAGRFGSYEESLRTVSLAKPAIPS
jgi:anthranilate phosphoribosyltransferase